MENPCPTRDQDDIFEALGQIMFGYSMIKDYVRRVILTADNLLATLESNPKLHRYSLLNLFGIQIVRYPFLRLLTRIRHLLYKPFDQEFYKNVRMVGLGNIPNYLEREAALEVEKAFVTLSSLKQTEVEKNGIAATSNSQVTRIMINEKSCAIYPAAKTIRDHFLRDTRINEIASDVVGYNLKTLPHIEIEYFNVPEGEDDIFNASQGYHIDRIQDCVSIRYLLDDASVHDGCIEYAEGSHKTFLMKYLYIVAESFRVAFHLIKSGLNVTRAIESSGVGRQHFFDKFISFGSRPVTAQSGSLSVSNHAGFHRRGMMSPGHKRRIIWFTFYHEYPSIFWSKVRKPFSLLMVKEKGTNPTDVH